MLPSRARAIANKAIADGILIRGRCEMESDECSSGPIEAHHDDYSDPLEVRWLCRRHHRGHHGRNGHARGFVREGSGVIVQCRVAEATMAKLARLAKANERSVAAELRVAIDRHLSTNRIPKGEPK